MNSAESPSPLPGRFLEIGLGTGDIRASVEFYERLGFTQAQTGDLWPHPYGVLTDGRLYLGLHQQALASPALTFVCQGVAARAAELERRGLALERVQAGEDAFHEIQALDPAGHNVRVLEARTFSPSPRPPLETSLLGYFAELSLPAAEFEEPRRVWEALGFVATGEERPYPNLQLTSDALDLALHRPSFSQRPLLVFREETMSARIARLRELGIALAAPPQGLAVGESALLTAPEGTSILLIA